MLQQAELQFKNDFATLNYLAGISDTTPVKLTNPKLQADFNITAQGFFNKRFDIDSLKTSIKETRFNLIIILN